MNDLPNQQQHSMEAAEQPRPWIRLLAFWLDISLVSAPVKLILYLIDEERYLAFSQSLYGLGPALLAIVTSLPLMALTTSLWGVTVGKALLGCSVKRRDSDTKIGFTRAYQRTVLSYVVGAGMNVALELTALTLFFCYRGMKFRGMAFWDAVYGTKVVHRTVRLPRILIFAVLLTCLRLAEAYPLLMTAQELMAEWLAQLG